MSLQSRFEVVAGGESGQKKFLRETLALFEVHNGTNLEKTSVSADELQVPSGIFFSLLPHGKVMDRD